MRFAKTATAGGQGPTPEQIDRLIVALADAGGTGPALTRATEKVDHLIHALRVSGRLERLSRRQVESILYSLKEAGHLKGWVDTNAWGKPLTYCQDGLACIHSAGFLTDPAFADAYRRGLLAAGEDYRWHWRVHVGLWAAYHANHLDGDFVECGVNRGCLSSAIMRYLDWNACGKRFFLLDTFKGLDPAHVSAEEKAAGKLEHVNWYEECFEQVRENFAEFKNVVIVRGSVPDTLPQVQTDKVCYLHLDMNCAPPEVAAITYLWDKLVPGAVVLLDDYGHPGFESQKHAMDRFAAEKDVRVLSLPTGQGLILKAGR
jgi:hypothetical protein